MQLLVQLGAEVSDTIAAFELGAVHRKRGMRQQVISIGAVDRGQCHADAGGQHDLVAGDMERFRKLGQQAARDRSRTVGILERRQQGREFVTLDP